MLALAASGNPAAAVQHARVHEMLLREDPNLALAPEIAAFVRHLQSIRAGEPSFAAAANTRSSIPVQ